MSEAVRRQSSRAVVLITAQCMCSDDICEAQGLASSPIMVSLVQYALQMITAMLLLVNTMPSHSLLTEDDMKAETLTSCCCKNNAIRIEEEEGGKTGKSRSRFPACVSFVSSLFSDIILHSAADR